MADRHQWQTYKGIVGRFRHKARTENGDDLVEGIIVRLAEVAASNGHKPFTVAGMLRTASYVVTEYWHNLKR